MLCRLLIAGIDFVEEIENGERKIKIKRIDPHGAANDDSTIKVLF
jgi:hypothetical protein